MKEWMIFDVGQQQKQKGEPMGSPFLYHRRTVIFVKYPSLRLTAAKLTIQKEKQYSS